ncbi:beta-ketoacyl-[acyl-carrier-protein] synthase family protein [Pectobacterium atrosepticum]|uniref:beta-ketoacyl-[acyl-carrier-protein] synthase family protein n=1 Tax=Pectobacterium atrosepticum TaxID=29471 RepID=UPI00049A2A87|nr:beta-ketoacyl-[acyl-carrier-protein] synthase family protein [Pectobacterium atrosepticum]AIA73246.1 3-oxoacyl-ACP synthase [Pectobacterium atrosepticum]AIK16276.1 putative beta-ketoacyl synthase [Pectobacterium atrosepticum]POW24948.1 beta-ketoacyl-[acyl-carrier-protein] synthase II [Pectobacterium atrosepticum]QWC53153.1 beta-ketoacyl-[acyl-carrier-protein] synthase family protein [Pectobacterium atrosepticum]
MIYINAVGALNALGNNLDEIADNLASGHAPGMRPDSGWLLHDKPCWTGNVDAELPTIPVELAAHNSRNNQLLLAALEQIRAQVDAAIAQFGPDRVAVVLGTSTSGLDEADRYVSEHLSTYHYAQQELGDPSQFLAAYLALNGPAYTLSTACSSSARALISGKRLIDAGLVDVAIVGGADTLSRMPLNGFDSLESLSSTRCQPFSEERNGITIGEGVALMLIGKQPDRVAVLGLGESSDAHHMSAPHPEGEGAIRAMNMALSQAGLQPEDVGYINLHGTATRLNDQIEANVVHAVFGDRVPCSSTKHLTGHTLGAAGISEAVLCWLLLTRDLPLPAQDFSHSRPDASLPLCGLLRESAPLARSVILSNSFAFGGNNTCLILGKNHE